MFNSAPSFFKSLSFIIFIYLIISGLYFASQFLIPIAISILLSMLLIPVSNKLEKIGLNRIWASLICIILMISLFGGIFYLVSRQASGISDNLREILLRTQQMTVEVQKFLAETLGISI
jgi:predicted PurR-regulated permease PerM